MNYHIAQLNIARFRLPQDHPNNADFVNNLDRINQIAEQQDGFIWRFKGEGNNAFDVKAFEDPNVASNMSLWASLESLRAFVYRRKEHREIMRRRHQWFDRIDFYLVLWWVKAGQIPSLEDAKVRLRLLENAGPTEQAFTFRTAFSPPKTNQSSAIADHRV
jgi:hypothetical protein